MATRTTRIDATTVAAVVAVAYAMQDADAATDVAPQHSSLPPACCRTHSNCRHSGVDCRDKAEGHIDAATDTNTQGGSEARFNLL